MPSMDSIICYIIYLIGTFTYTCKKNWDIDNNGSLRVMKFVVGFLLPF